MVTTARNSRIKNLENTKVIELASKPPYYTKARKVPSDKDNYIIYLKAKLKILGAYPAKTLELGEVENKGIITQVAA